MVNTFNSNTENFANVKTDIAFIDHDDTEFTRNFKSYLADYANFKTFKEDKLEDAFFYREIQMIIEIPKGFTDKFSTQEELKIKTKSVPDSAASYTLEQAMDNYLNLARTYQENNISTGDLHEAIMAILTKEAKTEFIQDQDGDYSGAEFYFNYLSYIFLGLIISVICSIMIAFKPLDIKRRNNLGAISNKKMNFILLFSNFLLAFLFYLILIIVALILYSDVMFKANGFLLMLNAFIFLLTVISLAYLLVVIFNSRNIVGALATVISLGSSFICGVFIPQFLIDDFILKIARIFPSYWYVNANEKIASLFKYDYIMMKPIYNSFLIQSIFTFIFIALALTISKAKQRAEN
jgi:ABC-2 type transport system permease protein